MEVLGVFIFAGGAFGALFFHQYADGYKPYLIIRNFLIAVAISGLIVFDSKYDPKINAARGTYWIEYGAYTELGVVRFEIISKKKR